MASIDPLTATGVLLATAATDAVYVMFTSAVVARKRVPAGSVGIAGNQTGVYPFATPGGWRLLGRTPIKMFRADRDGLSLLSIGDRVRFAPISAERFAALEKAWA